MIKNILIIGVLIEFNLHILLIEFFFQKFLKLFLKKIMMQLIAHSYVYREISIIDYTAYIFYIEKNW